MVGGKRGRAAAAGSIALVGLLGGCAPDSLPAPVVAAAPPPRTITIERGQTLLGIAGDYNVPMLELAAANHLSPPYRILAGGVLVIPAPGGVAVAAPAAAVITPPPAPVSMAAVPPQTVAPHGPVPMPTVPSAAPVSPPKPVAPTPSPSRSSLAGSSLAPPSEAAPPAHPKPAAPPATTATVTGIDRGGTFVWPVRGRIVEGYGAGPDGTHNDGINIAAPRGAPVQAVDGGVVAYAGNELRGYGDLVLIKHPNGWISAYAHCDRILVKRGQKVARGQVIARVGATGNVSTPQLHFELRRGDKPVDPRTYLAPPRAAAGSVNSG